MNIIVVGCGRVGASLSYRLFQAGHQVAVIDRNADAFLNLPTDFNGRLHEGDTLTQEVLLRAGIETADALAVVTNSDALNAVVGHVAREEYHVPTVVARNYDPHYRSLFEEFNLQVVSSTSWGSQRIEELLMDSRMHAVFSAGNGEVEIYEFAIPKDWQGKSIDELLPERNCILLSITRAGRAMLPSGDIIFQEGDVVHLSATFEGISEIRTRLFKSDKVEG